MIGHRDIDNARDAAGKEQLAKAIATAVSNHPGDYKAALSEFANAVRADKVNGKCAARIGARRSVSLQNRFDLFTYTESSQVLAEFSGLPKDYVVRKDKVGVRKSSQS